MEDEETGELFLPCIGCTQKCYRNHGELKKHRERERSNGCSYFYKVMLRDFAEKLRIPPAFVPKLTIKAGENIVLQGPSTQEWIVKLWGTETRLEFREGWEKFVHCHAIEFGDFLVFKYISKSNFKVRIFGRTGCVKNFTASGAETTNCDLQKTCPATSSFDHVKDSILLIDLVSDDENDDEAQTIAANRREKGNTRSVGRHGKSPVHCQPSPSGKRHKIFRSMQSNGNPYYFCGRHPVSEAERDKALKAAHSFKSEKPFCLMIMKSYFVSQAFLLEFPKTCRDRLNLPKQRREVILVDSNSKEWHVQYIWRMSGDGGGLSGGWKHFSVDNNLKKGDICVFERGDQGCNHNIKLRVHIFRV